MTINIKPFLFFLFACFFCACNNNSSTETPAEISKSLDDRVILSSDIEWTPLNPARGDASPQAGTLWGDRNTEEATGFIVQFKDGFSSPPHIHNTTYKGIVIDGLIHNDDPDAAKMWMPMGSFWTQPAGELHITAAKGEKNMAFIEIQNGPYLVQAAEQAFDNGERPVNVAPTNMVWLDLPDESKNNIQIAYLWGQPDGTEVYGALIKLPAQFSGNITNQGKDFRAVVINGQIQYQSEKELKELNPGSYFSSIDQSVHHITTDEQSETLIYIRTNGKIKISNK